MSYGGAYGSPMGNNMGGAWGGGGGYGGGGGGYGGGGGRGRGRRGQLTDTHESHEMINVPAADMQMAAEGEDEVDTVGMAVMADTEEVITDRPSRRTQMLDYERWSSSSRTRMSVARNSRSLDVPPADIAGLPSNRGSPSSGQGASTTMARRTARRHGWLQNRVRLCGSLGAGKVQAHDAESRRNRTSTPITFPYFALSLSGRCRMAMPGMAMEPRRRR